MEEQLLPRPELAPAYDKVVWLYVYRDFSKNDADRAAERTCLRFGFTSYPQHWLLHPETFERLASTGRSVESFLAAVSSARVGKIRSSGAASALAEAEKRAQRLEDKRSVKDATKALDDDDDIVVRFRALEVLAEEAPKEVVARAAALLAVPNDPFRYEVCEVLKEHPEPDAAKSLAGVVEEPKDSLNPNVLRMHAVAALAACGDAGAVAAIGPHAASGDYRNGLTNTAIDALVEIAERDKKAKKAVRDVLVTAFPVPTEDETAEVPCVALARRVHGALEKVTGRSVRFPSTYDADARAKLAKAW